MGEICITEICYEYFIQSMLPFFGNGFFVIAEKFSSFSYILYAIKLKI